MNDPILGQEPSPDPSRDAIHVAIMPVVAGVGLSPGEHVSIKSYNTAWRRGQLVGIVDPFRKGNVAAGERFWLCLYQKTVTGMRHHWSHPAFDDHDASSVGRNASAAYLHIKAAEQGIRDFANTIGWDYDEVMRSLGDAVDGDAYGGDDRTAEKFTDNKVQLFTWYAAITGKVNNDVDGTYFRCAC